MVTRRSPAVAGRQARGPRLPYWPALDGLRGLAVAAVLLFHAGVSWTPGGFLGVSLFFTLSGFLITGLAVAEHGATGEVGLRAFWGRRVRRLLPASLLALLLAVAVTAVAVPVQQRLGALGDIRAALLNVANWRFVVEGASYADLDLVPSPVQHYWSLAVEEQFYLLFPVVAAVALRWKAKGLAVALGVIAAASVAVQIVADDPNRVYFGTDTRAAELAIGGLLAIAMPHLRNLLGPRAREISTGAGTAGLLATLALWVGVEQQTPALYEGGLAAVSVASVLLILGGVGASDAGPLRILRAAPLVSLGRISYGVYLFHFPLYLLLDQERTGLGGAPLLAVRIAVTLAVAALSFNLLEMPIRTGRSLPGRRSALALGGAVAAVALVTVPVVDRVERQQLEAGVLADGVRVVPSVPAALPGPVDEPISGAPAAPGPAGSDGGRTGVGEAVSPPGVGSGPDVEPVLPAPTTAARPPRVVVVGDSTAEAAGAGLSAWGAETGRIEVTTVSSLGCAALHGPRFRIRDGYEFEPEGCSELFETAADQARAVGADAIVVWIGSSQLADWQLAQGGPWQYVGQDAFDLRYADALRLAGSQLAEAGVPVLWADVPTPDWDLAEMGRLIGATLPGSGQVTLNDPARAERLNLMDQEIVPSMPFAQRWAYAATLEEPDGTISRETRPDGLHVSEAGIRRALASGMFDLMRQAYLSVHERRLPGIAPPTRNAWSVSSIG